MGALKLGPDGKIYVTSETNNYNTYLGVINDPKTLGTSCSFKPKGLYLGGKLTRLGTYQVQVIIDDSKAGAILTDHVISIYPNPGKDILQIACPQHTTIDKIDIFDNNGKLIAKWNLMPASASLIWRNIKMGFTGSVCSPMTLYFHING